MKRTVWFLLFAFGLAACGGATTDPVTSAAGPDLSGLSLEVHQAPD